MPLRLGLFGSDGQGVRGVQSGLCKAADQPLDCRKLIRNGPTIAREVECTVDLELDGVNIVGRPSVALDAISTGIRRVACGGDALATRRRKQRIANRGR